MTLAFEILFWVALSAILFTHVGYPAVLWVLNAAGAGRGSPESGKRRRAFAFPDASGEQSERPAGPPPVSLVIAAYDEEKAIGQKVANALALDYPRDRLEVIVASDGSSDRTVELAREAGADLVLDLPRSGKTAAQDAAVARARGEIVAFSDANSTWEPDALSRLVEPFADDRVAYVCGTVSFVGPDGGNLEGAYWTWEMKIRTLESDFAGVTAGNGAIYAVRAADYLPLGATGSHDLSFPFTFAKQDLLSLYRPDARASEKVVPSLEGELARKRRMMVGLWDIVVGEGMVDPRGYRPGYAFEILSHRILRYLSPFLHLVLLTANVGLVAIGGGPFYAVTLAIQIAFLLAAALGRFWSPLPLRVARYYAMTTASIALGFWDRWRSGPPGTWEKAEGTR